MTENERERFNKILEVIADNAGIDVGSLDPSEVKLATRINQLFTAESQKAQGLVKALELVLKRGDIVQRSDQYMKEVSTACKQALQKYQEVK